MTLAKGNQNQGETHIMRLSETEIKQAIVHPEKIVREEALRYFTDCYSQDAEVMSLAIQAFETYGRGKAFLDIYGLARLAQTEATIEWAIRELHQEKDKVEDQNSYFSQLSHLLCNADLNFVSPRADEIVQAPGFDKDLVPGFRERLELACWDAEQCWKELERICVEGLAQSDDVDFDHARRVVQALARQGQKDVDRILDLLGEEVTDFETDPMTWLEIFLVMLVGEMRLERAAPLVVKKLHAYEAEFLWEECVKALGKIGTDAATEALAEKWLQKRV